MRLKWLMWPLLALGFWLFTAPFVLGFSGSTDAIVNNTIIGAATVTLVGVALFVRPVHRMIWVLAPLGAWQSIAPYALGYSSTAAVADAIVIGTILATLSVVAGLESGGTAKEPKAKPEYVLTAEDEAWLFEQARRGRAA